MEDKLLKIIKMGEDSGAEFIDLRLFKNTSTAIVVNNIEKKVEKNEAIASSIRVLYRGRWGYGTTYDTDIKSLQKALNKALRIAKIKKKGPLRIDTMKAIKDRVENKVKIDPSTIPLDKKVSEVERIFNEARKYEKIKTASASYSDLKNIMIFANSEGSYIEQKLIKSRAVLSVNARSGDKITDYYDVYGGAIGFEVVDYLDDETIRKIVENAKIQLNSAKCPKGNLPVVVDGSVSGVIAHETIGHPSEADFVVSGRSFLSGLIGKEIANKNVSIIDDATINSNGKYFYDHEGVPAQKTFIIKNGVLNSYLHSRDTASRFDTKSTGNGRTQGIGRKIFVRMSNTYFDKGDYEIEEMFEGIKYGVYAVKNVCGMENPVGGSFYASCLMGFLIENGKVTRPIRGEVVLTGNVLEILKNITAISKEVVITPGACGKGSEDWVLVGTGGPHIRIENLMVGGE